MLAKAARGLGVTFLFGAGMAVTPAYALEGSTAYLQGTTIGLMKGLPPAPGLSVSTKFLYRPNLIYDGNGHATGARADLVLTTPTVTWVPGVKLLGGTYSVYAIQPLSYRVVTSGGATHQAAGAFNTEVSPINLTWNVNKTVGVSTGLLVYLKDASFHRDGPVHVGNSYWTFEPSVGLTIHKNGWFISTFSSLDINTTNTNYVGALNPMGKRYHSGTTFYTDYTIERRHKNIVYGLGGYWGHQLEDDKVNGVSVPETATRTKGNRLEQFAVGPVFGIDVGPITVLTFYTHDVVHQEAVGGDAFWLRITAKIK
jgi:hypothetical protein